MDCCNSIRRTPAIQALPNLVKTQRGVPQASLANIAFSTSPRKTSLQSQNLIKVFGAPESRRQIYGRRKTRPLVLAIANAEPKGCKYIGVGTPLEPSSPEGMFLSGILQNQRHLFQFALSEQLDELASDRDRAAAHKKQTSDSMESFLHRKVAEMKENECQIAIEDVIYMSIVHKFTEVGVPMVPKLSNCITNNNTLEIWPSKRRELESIHSLEFQEMIREHLGKVLLTRGKSSAADGLSTTKIDRLHLGRIYAASIMYGYFLKSASYRRQLDLSLARTHEDLSTADGAYSSVAETYSSGFNNLVMLDESMDAGVASLCQESRRCDTRPEKLSSYVKEFDSESLQRCAKLKSKEAVNVIERHTWALVGDERVGVTNTDNDVVITFPSLERLVLEAVAFGSFLWDVERSVDSVYGLHQN